MSIKQDLRRCLPHGINKQLTMDSFHYLEQYGKMLCNSLRDIKFLKRYERMLDEYSHKEYIRNRGFVKLNIKCGCCK